MAKLKDRNTEREIKVKDGEKTAKAAEKLGVPFSCNDGICGTCKVGVVKGKENLSEINEKEIALGCDENNRLMCQGTISGGEVEISF